MTKKIKENLTEVIQIRVTTFEKNRFKFSAKLYGYKNLSEFLVTCATNFHRMLADENDIPRVRRKGDLSIPDFLINKDKIK